METIDRVGPYTSDCLMTKAALDKVLKHARRSATASPILRPHLLILARTIRSGERVTLEMIRPFYPTSLKFDGETGRIIGSADIPPVKKFW